MTGLARPVVVVLGALTAFAPMSIDMYLPSLPTLERVFATTATSVQLTLSAFLAGLAIGQAFYGPMSDRLGRRSPLMAGIAIYVAASIGCVFAPDVETLIALRFIQELGGCAGPVIARTVVRDLVSGQEAARIFSTLMLIMGLAPILAPLVGGYLLVWFDWAAIFWALGAFGASCLLAVARFLPETRPSAARISGGIGAALRTYGRLVRDRVFMGYVLGSAFCVAGMFVYITASPHLLINGFGIPANAYGWVFGANAAGLIGASQINRALLRRMPVERMLGHGGRAYMTGALILLAVAISGFGGLMGLLAALFATIASLYQPPLIRTCEPSRAIRGT